jgi:hypothetical protein
MSDDYLVMARVMAREWDIWKKENVWGKGYTGLAEIAIAKAYKDAFMAGFYLKFTKADEKV